MFILYLTKIIMRLRVHLVVIVIKIQLRSTTRILKLNVKVRWENREDE